MTNPTKGQTPTAEELLKEAAEFINNLIDGDKIHWQTPEAERALKLRSEINTHLSSPPYPLGSSRELLQESARLLKYWIELDSNGLVEYRKDSVLTYKQINNFLFQSQEPSPASVSPALTWGQALDKGAIYVGYSDWEQIIEFVGMHSLKSTMNAQVGVAIEKAAHLFMEANRLQRWIPVEERLPETEHNIYVLVWIPENQSVFTSCYYDDLGFTTPAGARGKITHWQPLPEVPK